MKTKIFFPVIVLLVILTLFSCEENFEPVTDDVYKIADVQRSGCFNYDPSDTLSIKPILGGSGSMELEGDTCFINVGQDYYCFASDSLFLVGNTLKIYLKALENNDCECAYVWDIKLKVTENKGIKVLIYCLKNDKYELESEAYKIKL